MTIAVHGGKGLKMTGGSAISDEAKVSRKPKRNASQHSAASGPARIQEEPSIAMHGGRHSTLDTQCHALVADGKRCSKRGSRPTDGHVRLCIKHTMMAQRFGIDRMKVAQPLITLPPENDDDEGGLGIDVDDASETSPSRLKIPCRVSVPYGSVVSTKPKPGSSNDLPLTNESSDLRHAVPSHDDPALKLDMPSHDALARSERGNAQTNMGGKKPQAAEWAVTPVVGTVARKISSSSQVPPGRISWADNCGGPSMLMPGFLSLACSGLFFLFMADGQFALTRARRLPNRSDEGQAKAGSCCHQHSFELGRNRRLHDARGPNPCLSPL